MKITSNGPQNVGQVETYFSHGDLFLSSEEYQREGVWKLDQKRLLIDTVFRGMDIPKFYFWKIDERTLLEGYPEGETKDFYKYLLNRKRQDNDDPDPHIFEVVDGQQRLRTLLEYMRVEPPETKSYRGTWHPAFTAMDDTPMAKGKKYSQLNAQQATRFKQGTLTVMVLEDASIDEIRDMFLRLQNGTPLNAQQKRDAMGSLVGRAAIDLANLSFFTNCVNFGNANAAHHSVAAQMLNLELRDKVVSCDSRQLDKLYGQHKEYPVGSNVQSHAKRVLKALDNIFASIKAPRLNRSYALTLYWVLSSVMKNYIIPQRDYRTIRENFEALDNSRLEAREREYAGESDEVYEELSRSMSRGTDGLDAISTRHDIMAQYLFDDVALKEKPSLDPQRLFSWEERLLLYRRAEGKCELGEDDKSCGRPVDFDYAAIDHIVPHSKGGRTELSNGRVAYTSCNKAKGNRDDFDPRTDCRLLNG